MEPEVEDLGRKHFVYQQSIEREKKFFYIRTEFVPDLKAASVTNKFYAKHEAFVGAVPNPDYLRKIELVKALGPREKYTEPCTENNRYGWVTKTLLPLNKSDRLLSHYRKFTPLTIVAAEIEMATRNAPKDPPFTGTPFKL